MVAWASCSIRSQLARFPYRPVPRAMVATLTVGWGRAISSRTDCKRTVPELLVVDVQEGWLRVAGDTALHQLPRSELEELRRG